MNPKFAPWMRFYDEAGDDGDKGGGGGMLSDHKVEGDDDGKTGDDDGKKGEEDEAAKKAAADEAAAAAAKVTPMRFDARPDHVPENFWKGDEEGDGGSVDLEALTKSHNDLRTRQAKQGKAPDKPADYTFEFETPVPGMEVKGDDPLVNAFRTVAHAEGLSQEVFNRLATNFTTEMIKHTQAKIDAGEMERYDKAAEMKALGDSGKPMMDGVKGWLKGLVARGQLSEAMYARLETVGDYAEGVKGLAVLRSLAGEQPIPMGEPLEGEGLPSDEDLHRMVDHPDYYVEGSAYRKKVDELFAKRYGKQPAGTSPAGLGVAKRAKPNAAQGK